MTNLRPSRRDFLRQGLLGAAAFAASGRLLADVAGIGTRAALAGAAGAGKHGGPAGSLILVWLEGGASQLETFDPKPGTRIGGPTRGIDTPIKGVQICDQLPRVAELFDRFALVRSMMTGEGAHERGRYLLHTGYKPNPAVAFPTIGAWCAHCLGPEKLDIPRNMAILRATETAGILGTDLDPLVIGNPDRPLDDVKPRVDGSRLERRLSDLDFLDKRFVERRADTKESAAAYRSEVSRAAQRFMMGELEAFEIDKEPQKVRERYGESAFGKGCLLARRMVEAGVPAIEVTLGNWDLHAANFQLTPGLNADLDAGLASLVEDLEERDLLKSTVIVVATEFGRTPAINPAEGRDHHPNGFSIALAGGGIRGGTVIGETDPQGENDPTDPVSVPDLMSTVLTALNVSPGESVFAPNGRPIAATDGGKPIERLLKA